MEEASMVVQKLAEVAEQLQNEEEMYSFLVEKTQPMTTKYGMLLEELAAESKKSTVDRNRLMRLQLQIDEFEPQVRIVSDVLHQFEEHQQAVREQLYGLASVVSSAVVAPVSQVPEIAPKLQAAA